MERIEILKQDIRQCRLCKDLPLGQNPVIRGNASARILVAGQAPGIRVHNTGIPFNDPSGVRLREWMGIDDSVFYDESKVAIVPMGFCYPGTGKSGDLPPRKECAQTWHQAVLEALENIQLVLAIGQYSQSYHLASSQRKTLTETVKSWRDYFPHILPLPHPSPRNNRWLKMNPFFEREVVPELKIAVKKLLDE